MKRNLYIFSFILIIYAAVFSACASLDMESKTRLDSGLKSENSGNTNPNIITVPIEKPPAPTQIVEVEKPVYIPEPKNTNTTTPDRGRPAVETSARSIRRPQDYSASAFIYDYNPDWVYEVYCQPLRATDIRLEPGERAAEPPFVSDSERWMLGAGINQEAGQNIQHIYIKPTASNIEASLIINTDRRVYHLIVRSFADIHMPLVRWKYPYNTLPNNYITDAGQSAAGITPGLSAVTSNITPASDIPLADARFLSFNYKVTWALFKKPKWIPDLVYDDGSKTYITFPRDIAQGSLPAIYENRNDIVNYRVVRNIVIIDKLIETLTIKLDDRELSIEKKRK